MGAELRIWLLGGFRAAVDGTPVAEESWRRAKAKALVKLLALARGKRLHREQLMDALWPDLAPEAAAANLRKAVYFARRALAPEHLRLRDEMLRLEAAHLWVDVDAFEVAAEGAHALSAGTNPHQRMHATWPIIAALYHLGRWEEALAVVDEHVEAFHQDQATGCSFVRDGTVMGATMLVHRGETERARALAAVVGDPMEDLATASAWQARYATAAGDPQTARRISAGKARERWLYGQQHLETLLEALAALEDWDAVAELLPEARARVDGNALLAPVGDRVEGLAHARAGRRAEAGRALRRALDRFEQLGDPFEAARTREHLAAVAPAPDARSLLEAALATYERLACAPCERAARARLGALERHRRAAGSGEPGDRRDPEADGG